ncbi:hypothetical protein ABEX47_27535 [Paenibacillus ehimensis]|uniref:hypothetical protein n=1 Tax=Paenibacillus ehimensis TaxID=79264 RepID=UPI003D2D0FFA
MKQKTFMALYIILLILGFTVVAPYQYGMSMDLFYVVTIGCILTSICLLLLIIKTGITNKVVKTVIPVSLIIFSVVEINTMQPHFRLKQKIEAYVPDAPIKIVGFIKLDPATLAKQEGIRKAKSAKNELSQIQGTSTIFLSKEISTEIPIDLYTIIFKRPYLINGVDVSDKVCFGFNMCNYRYKGHITINSKSGEMLAFSVVNSGVEK